RDDLVTGVQTCALPIFPMELLVGAPQEAALAEQLTFLHRREGDMHRGRLAQPAEFNEAGGKSGTDVVGAGAGARQQAAAGRRGRSEERRRGEGGRGGGA